MKKTFLFIVIIICAMLLCSCEKNNVISKDSVDNTTVNNNKEGDDSMEEFTTKINIIINNKTYSVTLEDNESSREFIKRLPLNITMNELNGNEKYYYFAKSLPSKSTKIDKIHSGDLMLYGNDCLVLFYDTFNTSYSYTRIGKIDNPSDIKDTVGNGNINVFISK